MGLTVGLIFRYKKKHVVPDNIEGTDDRLSFEAILIVYMI